MMSFWKRKLLGVEADKLPESSTAPVDRNEGPAVPKEEPVVGPPPTATAYTHRPLTLVIATPKDSTPQPEPPSFQIFQPKPQAEPETQEETTSSNDSPQQIEKPDVSPITSPTAVSPAASPKHTSSVELQQQEEDDWDFDKQDMSLETNTLENTANEQKFGNDRHELLQETTEQTEWIQEDLIEKQDFSDSVSQPELLQYIPMQTESVQADVGLSPKFYFVNESVPLQKLADTRSKRRHEALARIHELDLKLASLQAKLAHECMDRATAMGNITLPLVAAIERIGNQLILPSDGRLHARILKLEVDQMRYLYVSLPDAVSDELESPQDYVAQELQARQKLENSKADKREGSMVRRFESIAGTAARRYLEESASLRACLAQVQSLAQDAADLDEQRSKDFLESLKKLRESLRQERQERKAQDKRVMDSIMERTAELKRALLEAAGSN
jgi:hypothetical protein